jgi:hypothetical protein
VYVPCGPPAVHGLLVLVATIIDPPIEQVLGVVEDRCWVVITLFSLSRGSRGSYCHCRGLEVSAVVPCAVFSAGGATGSML